MACGAEIAADRKMLPEVIPEKDCVEGDADKGCNRGPFNTDDWDEQHIEDNVEEGRRTACIEGLTGMVNGAEGCTKEDHEHVYDLEQKQDGTGCSAGGELCTVEEVKQTIGKKDPACGSRYGKQKSVGDTLCQNTRDLGEITFCTPVAELRGKGSGYGGGEECSCGGELQCHPVHADIAVVHKVADKDGVCIGEDKRAAADEKRPERVGDEAPEMVCSKSGGTKGEVFDTEHAGDDNCDDESAKEPCKRVAKEDCNYLDEDANKLIDTCGKVIDADVAKAVNPISDGVAKKGSYQCNDNPGDKFVLLEVNEVGADRKEEQR